MSLSPEEREALNAAVTQAYGHDLLLASPDHIDEAIWIAAKNYAYEQAAKVAFNTPDKFGTLANDSHKECALVASRLIRYFIRASTAKATDTE